MDKFAKYTKRSAGAYSDYLPQRWSPSPGVSILLQVTLGTMPLDEAFTVYLPSDYARLTAAEFFDIAFSDGDAQQAKVRERLDLKGNPDLPDIYAGLLEIFEGWRGGRYALRFFTNNGPEVDLSHRVGSYLRMRHSRSRRPSELVVWDLVVEQRPRSLDYAVERGYAESSAALLGWLQERSLLYAVGVGGYEAMARPASERHGALWSAAERLVDEGLLRAFSDRGALEVTGEGDDALAGMAAEAESHAESYGIFEDVLYDSESGVVEFGTGRGDDLRVQVYAAEGIDPPTAVFLVSLFGPELQGLSSGGAEWIAEQQHFEDILATVLDDRLLGEAEIEHVIESGLALKEERQEEFERGQRENRVMDRSTRPGPSASDPA